MRSCAEPTYATFGLAAVESPPATTLDAADLLAGLAGLNRTPADPPLH